MAVKKIQISATQKLLSDIAEKVKKTFGIETGTGLTASPADLAGSSLKLELDYDAVAKELEGKVGGGDNYQFSGDDYIDVFVDGVKQ